MDGSIVREKIQSMTFIDSNSLNSLEIIITSYYVFI